MTAIVSKLALLPHPQLHEYLLRVQPAAPATRTLYTTLRGVAHRLAADVPRVRDHRRLLEHTRTMLMSEDPAYDDMYVPRRFPCLNSRCKAVHRDNPPPPRAQSTTQLLGPNHGKAPVRYSLLTCSRGTFWTPCKLFSVAPWPYEFTLHIWGRTI